MANGTSFMGTSQIQVQTTVLTEKIRRKMFTKTQNSLIKLKASPSDETAPLGPNHRAIPPIFHQSSTCRRQFETSLIIF